MLTEPRVQWALRNRKHNGLADAVYESRGGELLIQEAAFLRWFLDLDGRAKPRASRRKSRKGKFREGAQQPLLRAAHGKATLAPARV